MGSSDQLTIMEAICTVKEASFDGVDCVGGDDAATGTVSKSSNLLLLVPRGPKHPIQCLFVPETTTTRYGSSSPSQDSSEQHAFIFIERGANVSTALSGLTPARSFL